MIKLLNNKYPIIIIVIVILDIIINTATIYLLIFIKFISVFAEKYIIRFLWFILEIKVYRMHSQIIFISIWNIFLNIFNKNVQIILGRSLCNKF
jgi:hypothetical protein